MGLISDTKDRLYKEYGVLSRAELLRTAKANGVPEGNY
jgi:hypothetical protein